MSPADDRDNKRRGQISQEDRDAFRRRAKGLGDRLGEIRAKEEAEVAARARRGPTMMGPGLGQALRFAAELVVGVGVGAFIGWWLDGYFGTKPWALVLFVALGFAGAMMNIIRAAKRAQYKGEPAQEGKPEMYDED